MFSVCSFVLIVFVTQRSRRRGTFAEGAYPHLHRAEQKPQLDGQARAGERHELEPVHVVLLVAARHITSHHVTSHLISSHHITSHHITSHHITSHHITSHHITSHHITSHHITSHHVHAILLCLRHPLLTRGMHVNKQTNKQVNKQSYEITIKQTRTKQTNKSFICATHGHFQNCRISANNSTMETQMA